MALISEKVQKFLVRIGNVWPKRLEDENVDAWVIEWENALKEFDGWVIEAAATRIIHDRTQAGFPFPAEVRRVCFQVLADDRASKPTMKLSATDQGDPFAIADILVNCEMGREAARAEPCWLLALHDFCRENRRLPTGQEIAKCKRTAAEFEENYRKCITGNAGAFSKSLTALAETMIRRRERMRERLIGRAAA